MGFSWKTSLKDLLDPEAGPNLGFNDGFARGRRLPGLRGRRGRRPAPSRPLMKRLVALAAVAGILVVPATASANGKPTNHSCKAWGNVTIKVGRYTTCKVGRAVASRLARGPVWRATPSGNGFIQVLDWGFRVTRPSYTSYRAANRTYDKRVFVDFHIVGG